MDGLCSEFILHNLDKAFTFLRVCGLSHVVRTSGAFPQYYAHGGRFSQHVLNAMNSRYCADLEDEGRGHSQGRQAPPVAGKQRQILSHDLQDNLSPSSTLILDK